MRVERKGPARKTVCRGKLSGQTDGHKSEMSVWKKRVKRKGGPLRLRTLVRWKF